MGLKLLFVLNSILVLILMPWTVRANEGGWEWVHTLVQEEQDVEVTIRCLEGLENPPWTLNLVRRDSSGEVVVVEDMELSPEDADEVVGPYCQDFGADTEWCGEHPETCMDCNGDGTNECDVDHCGLDYRYVLIDECVPPGDWTYEALAFESGYSSIIVTDTGDNCLDSGLESGCSVRPVRGDAKSKGLLAVFMIAIGLFFFFSSRKWGE